jgi:hypothetical protein
MDGPNALALNERLLEVLADAGLDPADAARAAYLLIIYVFGSIALEVADLHQPGPLPPESERIDTRLRAFSATPAEHYPRTAAPAAELAGYISIEQYLWGLRRVLDGITTGAAADADPMATTNPASRLHTIFVRFVSHRTGADSGSIIEVWRKTFGVSDYEEVRSLLVQIVGLIDQVTRQQQGLESLPTPSRTPTSPLFCSHALSCPTSAPRLSSVRITRLCTRNS